MNITIGVCLVAAVIRIGTMVLSSIESTIGPNVVAIFFKYCLVANVKLVSECFFLRLFLACLVFTSFYMLFSFHCVLLPW